MSPFEIDQWLRTRDIRISARNGKLLIDGPDEMVTPELVDKLRNRKAELIAYLEAVQDDQVDDAHKKGGGDPCPATGAPCRALATYDDRPGWWCAYHAIFEQRGIRPHQVYENSPCPRSRGT